MFFNGYVPLFMKNFTKTILLYSSVLQFSVTVLGFNSDGNPLCSAGPDRVICSASTQLEGSGLQGKAVWSVLSAPEGGKAEFADSLDPKTTVSFSKKGTYLLRWGGAYGGDLVCYDQVSITWASPHADICDHALACVTSSRKIG